MSETCCTRRKNVAKNRHLGTIAQFCRAITSQLRHVSTIWKKLVKQRYVLHMSPQYGELRPTNGWDPSGSLRHPCKFQRVSRPGSVTARHLVFFFIPRLISAVGDSMSAILPHIVWPQCEFRMHVWNVLHAARWKIQDAKKSPWAPSHNFVGLYFRK